MTIPSERFDAPSENLIMFAERPAGSPQAIQVWFYPGDKIGEEFVYPRSQAIAIAKANHQPVLATTDEGNKNAPEADRMAAMRGASVGRVDEKGRMTSDESRSSSATTTAENENRSSASTTAAPANTVDGSRQARTDQSNTADRSAQAPAPRSTRSSRNAVGTSGQTTTAQQNGNRRQQLPRTASNLAALELISAVAFAGAIATRRLRRAADARG